jgi:radical SAM protein with 4Fe4S-binding SPASM domain
MIKGLTKPFNVLLAGYSFLKGSVEGRAMVYGMPLAIGAELTNYCNLQCPECSSGSRQMQRERGFMEIELFKSVMSELQPYIYYTNLYFQGEPMLHPLFTSFIRNCSNTKTVISTNGHFLSEENAEKIVRSGLNKLIISLDGIDQETYSAYRIDGNINTVLEGMKNIADAKKKFDSSLKIEIQFLVNKLNENQIPQIRQVAKKVKSSLKLKSMQIINRENIELWLPLNERFRRYKTEDGKYVVKNSLHDRCARLWFNPVITWDGKVIPCCFDKDAKYVMGDLNKESFREIWNGPKYRIFRKMVLSDRSAVEICRNCTSGLRGVKY